MGVSAGEGFRSGGALFCSYPSINVKFQALSSPLSTKEDKSQLVVREPKEGGGLGEG